MTLSEAEAAYKLALFRLENGEHPETREADLATLEQAAAAGYAPAQYAYANALDLFKGDIPGGVPWLIAAARQGHADAHYRLRELYAHREEVRACASELLTSEEVQRLQLQEGNWLVRFFGREHGYNSRFGQLVGMLVGLAIACPLAWYNLMDAAAGWEVPRLWRVLWKGMLVRQAGVWFGLCFFVAAAVDWAKPGEAGEHPLVVGSFCLLLIHVALSLLAWGGYELSHCSQAEEYGWLAGGLACLAGGVMLALFLLQVFFHLCRKAR